jgi:hypothetical protein
MPYGKLARGSHFRVPAPKRVRCRKLKTSSDAQPNAGEVDSALLDAELFVKYHSPERAIKRLKTALERNPRSIALRERLREVAATHKHPEEAARQGLALASLYIERDDFDSAYDRPARSQATRSPY